MTFTITAIEGALIICAGIIPLVLVLGSVEQIFILIDRYRQRRALRKQVRLLRQRLGSGLDRAA